MDSASPSRPGAQGRVALVGAGPGRADLLTLRALERLRQAQAVVYDQLVGPEVQALMPAAAQRFNVGKAKGQHRISQGDINALLVRLARDQGLNVVRLKGGDPFIFGRGGEELQALAAAGVPVEVVPGITAAAGVAAACAMPLTHRDAAQRLVFATGHLKDGSSDLDWATLAHRHQTVVFYMGLSALEDICRQLQAHGLPPDWPAALVSQGTLPSQRMVAATLASLPAQVAQAGLRAPSLVIVGEVVGLFGPRAEGG